MKVTVPCSWPCFSCATIAYIALYLAHGFNTLTTVALLGTLAALALTIAFSAIFTALCHFSGFATEEALVLGQLAQGVDITGLFLAGVVIGALGALDDVTVTQAAAIADIAADPDMKTRRLYQSGLRIGRDHIASTTNTLALAYAGAALPLLLLLVLSSQSLGTAANSEVVATEIVRTLVGSIGLVAAVPITTWLAVRVISSPPTRPHAPRTLSGRHDRPPAGPVLQRTTAGAPSIATVATPRAMTTTSQRSGDSQSGHAYLLRVQRVNAALRHADASQPRKPSPDLLADQPTGRGS